MKRSNRRAFIGKSAAAAGAVLATTSALGTTETQRTAADPTRPPIVHHVFFWLKNPSSTEDRDQLVTGLKTLAGIPLIKELYVGILANTEKRDVVDASWQVSELMFFNDLQSQATYQQHQIHLDFVKNCSHLWEKVVVYDTMNLYNRIG
jgi:Stress responsive A/B Barrel Domain